MTLGSSKDSINGAKGILSEPLAIVPTCVLLVLVRLSYRVCASCWSGSEEGDSSSSSSRSLHSREQGAPLLPDVTNGMAEVQPTGESQKM